MSSPDTPKQPDPPDYAAANREAIYTDIDTLPIRRAIEQASRLGQVFTYADPETGESRTADFTGLSDADAARALAQVYGQTNADLQRQQLALRQELGVANVQQTARELEAGDPQAWAARQALTGQILGALLGESATIAPHARVGDAAARLQSADPSTAALNFGLMEALQDYQRGGALDPQTARLLTDQVRSGQAARGNYLGDAAAVMEAGTMGAAAEQRRAQRLAALLGVQQQAFGQSQTLNQAALQGAQALSQEERAARAETYGRTQQNLANASAMVLGQPISNQFGNLAGAQNGAVAFNPMVAGMGMNAQANAQAGQLGTAWAQQNYGQAVNMWTTRANIAAQDAASMNSLIGAGAGAAASMMM